MTKIKWTGGDGTLTGAMEKYDLDAIIVPTDISYRVAAPGGLPIVTVPMGAYPEDTPVIWNERHTLKEQAPNKPFGLSFIGLQFSEEKLIAYARVFEAATQVCNKGPKPYVMPRTNLKDVIKSHKPCHDKQ